MTEGSALVVRPNPEFSDHSERFLVTRKGYVSPPNLIQVSFLDLK